MQIFTTAMAWFFILIFFVPNYIYSQQPSSNSISTQSEFSRLKMLNAVADIWGKCYLFHPFIFRSNQTYDWQRMYWSAALEKSLPILERTSNAAEFTALLNQSLLDSLSDAGTFAVYLPVSTTQKNTHEHKAQPTTMPIQHRIDSSIVYLDCSQLLLSDTSSFQYWYNTLAATNIQDTLIIDMRPQNQAYSQDALVFITECLRTRSSKKSSLAYIIHNGWNEFGTSAYEQQWAISSPLQKSHLTSWSEPIMKEFSRRKLKPLQRTVVFIVNKVTFMLMRDILANLQQQDNVFIILDKSESPFIARVASSLIPPKEKYIIHSDTVGVVAFCDLLRYNNKIFSIDGTLIPSDTSIILLASRSRAIIRQKRASGMPDFTSEAPFRKIDFDNIKAPLSRETKIRGFIKTWTIVRYFAPIASYTSSQWDSIFIAYIPKVEQTTSLEEYHLVMQQFITLLHDSHSAQWIMPASQQWNINKSHIPIQVKKIEDKLLITQRALTLADSVDIRVGDEILKLNSQTPLSFENFWKSYTPASHQGTFYRTLYSSWWLDNIMSYTQTTTLTLSIKRGSQTHSRVLALEKSVYWKESTTPTYQRLQHNIGYLRIFDISFDMLAGQYSHYDSLISDIQQTAQGLILDARSYPRGDHFELVKRFLQHPTQGRIYEIPSAYVHPKNGCGFNIETPVHRSFQTLEPHPTTRYTKPLIVLIDETTQSAAEDFCLYLSGGTKNIFVGSTTAGINGNITSLKLSGEAFIGFTGMSMIYPDGRPFQRIGILPDVNVTQTVKGFLEGRDEILEKGIEVLQQLLNKKQDATKIRPTKTLRSSP